MFDTLMASVIKRVKSDRKIGEGRMRVSKVQAAQNRHRMLTAAARLFRERGIGATSVDAITEDAGLTHGAVYSQFGSKEAVAAEAIRDALAGSVHLWQRLIERRGSKNAFAAIVAAYLSREHRDSAGRCCLVAALGSEIGRQPDRVRDVFTEELKGALEVLAGAMPRGGSSRSYDDAIAAFASMAGALILARAVSDRSLSERILKASAARVSKFAGSRRRSRQSPPSIRVRRSASEAMTKQVNQRQAHSCGVGAQDD